MSKTTKNERMVKQNALRVLEIANLNVDYSYQRGVTSGVKKIAEDYDPIAFGIPLIGERSDGTFWIVDGQQRIEAIKLRNDTRGPQHQQKHVRAEVFASDGPEHEAMVFKRVNKNRTQLKPLQLYHAMLTAGDAHTWKMKELIEKHGFKIPKGESRGKEESVENRAKRLSCVNRLSRILAIAGEEGLDFVLSVMSKVWPDDPLRTKGELFAGLYLFWKNHDQVVDLDRLIPRLMTTTPAKIIYSAGLGINKTEGNVADVLERIYRKQLKKPTT